jgi:hypothetical protein
LVINNKFFERPFDLFLKQLASSFESLDGFLHASYAAGQNAVFHMYVSDRHLHQRVEATLIALKFLVLGLELSDAATKVNEAIEVVLVQLQLVIHILQNSIEVIDGPTVRICQVE